MQDNYLYMHVIEYDKPGNAKHIFQIIDIYDPVNPFAEIKDYVASVHAETLTETQSQVFAVQIKQNNENNKILDINQTDYNLCYRRISDDNILEATDFNIVDTCGTFI